MSWISNIFGSDEIVDTSMTMLDNAFYTDQEKADMKIKLLEAYRPFKLIQRGLALGTTLLFSLIVVIELILAISGIWFPSAMSAISVLNDMEVVNMVGYGWTAIMSLYFGGGFLSSLVNKKD